MDGEGEEEREEEAPPPNSHISQSLLFTVCTLKAVSICAYFSSNRFRTQL